MKTETLKLTQVKVNEHNPRTITERKFKLLIESILTFPKMLDMRPVVIDDSHVALGGNMRLKALAHIADLDINEVQGMLGSNKEFLKKSPAERSALLDYWGQWLQAPTVPVVKASSLSKEEREHFIIADNASFGQWDYDELAGWDNATLQSWGVDVWLPDQPLAQPQAQPFEHTPVTFPDQTDISNQNLPVELMGSDLMPDALPKIEGDDQVAMERIIIVYPKERTQELAGMFGMEGFDKVVYSIDELLGEEQ